MRSVIALLMFFLIGFAPSVWSAEVYFCESDGSYTGKTSSPSVADFNRDHTLVYSAPCPASSADPSTNAVCITEAEARTIDAITRRHRKCQDTGADTFMDVVVEIDQAEKDVLAQAALDAAIAAVRDGAERSVDSFDTMAVLIRAVVLVTRDEINLLRSQHGLPDRTIPQLKNAIKSKIISGDVD